MIRVPVRRSAMVLGMASVAVATFAFRWLSLADLKNDHFDHVARAYQVLLGEWPVRDFVDPGLPLTYLLSAAAIAAMPDRPLVAETLLFAAGFAVAAALSFRSALLACGSAVIALVCVALQVAAYPRTYSYPKLLVYALAVTVGWWVVDRGPRSTGRPGSDGPNDDPGARRLAALAAVTAVAYYFRHDHGLYVGLGSLVLLTVHLWAGGVARLVRALALYAAFTTMFVLPHLIYVQWHSGLGTYLAIARDYGRMEAQTNPFRLPSFSFAMDPQNSVPFLFWLCWVIPAVAAVVLLRGHSAPGLRGQTAKIAMVIALAVCVNVGFVRDALVVRLPDVVVPHTVLGAWLLAVWWHWPAGIALRNAARVAVVVSTLAVGAAVLTAFETAEHVERSRLSGGLDEMVARWSDVARELRQDVPDLMPSEVLELAPFFGYVRQCTAADDKLLYVGYQPEVFVLARRGFAGGHLMFMSRFHATPLEQALAVERLANEKVPFVLLPAASRDAFREGYADVSRYIDAHYVPMASVETDAGRLEVLIDSSRNVHGATHGPTGWPCLVPQPTA